MNPESAFIVQEGRTAKERKRTVDHEFYHHRDQLTLDGKLFEDDRFKGSGQQGEGGHQSWKWGRPITFSASPLFVDGDSMVSAFCRGAISSDSFAIVLDVLRSRDDLWRYVVAEDQSFEVNYSGMFLFRFWSFDRVVPIVIDDEIPLDFTKRPLLTTFVDNNCLWCTLLEKAYAKFLGGYERLKTVTLPEAMTDILGCSVHLFPLKSKGIQTLRLLKNIFQYDGVLIVSLRDQNFPLDKDLNTLFLVTSMKMETNEDDKNEWILTLKNPFTTTKKALVVEEEANPEEEMDCSNEVNSTDLIADWNETLRISLGTFLKVFDELYVGLMRYPELSATVSNRNNWETQTIVGRWGDLRQHDGRKLSDPFLKIVVDKRQAHDDLRLCTVMVSLLQFCHNQSQRKLCNMMGLMIFGLRDTEGYSGRIPKKLLSLSEPVVQTDMHEEREISLYLRLEAGEYLIIPQRKRFCNEFTQKCQKYMITLFSLGPLDVMSIKSQKYGKEYLVPLELEVKVSRYVVVGDPIKIIVKIKEMPSMTRFTITVTLKFLRTAPDALEHLIKARLEYIEVCQGLLDKELSMVVDYHEYIKFPIQSEEFMIRCSAFVHELSTEVKLHKVVTTIMPKLKMSIDKKMFTRQQCLMTAMLQNSLPIFIHSAKFRVLCSESTTKSNSSTEVPPFSALWIICLLKFMKPGCQVVRTIFTSSAFHRTAFAKVQVMSSVSPVDLCPPSEKSLLFGEYPPINTKPDIREIQITCCPKHKTITESLDRQTLRPSWLIKGEALSPETKEVPDDSSEDAHMRYCEQTRDLTPEAECPDELIPIELKL
ncbi:hypothetical protein GE061_014027 [Apolygus lucorum]|uniref:Calpain catalytic domain-containing protein n=1 Tax=Apolygus lucorum TaxID=248454 RepID=A0A8S9XTI7_APOLU|nr:hypothetical protein GE061_014027 [Apolygus lucorum]